MYVHRELALPERGSTCFPMDRRSVQTLVGLTGLPQDHQISSMVSGNLDIASQPSFVIRMGFS
jgi:hypothetical protein